MMNYKIADIEGVGASMSQKLSKAGIKTVHGLLKKGATKKGRKEVAEASGIDETVILKWVNMADLYRVKGIGKQYAELLEKAGVDTVKELRTRNAENLVAKIAEANAAGKKRMVRLLPGLKRVESWIEEAKKLEPMVTY
jgi:predicted flap endonuclease-1-like 5' DNA nuclease